MVVFQFLFTWIFAVVISANKNGSPVRSISYFFGIIHW